MPEPKMPEATVPKQITPMLAYWDKYLVCRFANDAYLQWFGKHRRDMINKMTLLELLGANIFHLNLPYIESVLKGQPQTFEREIPVLLGKGTRYSHATYFPHIVGTDVKGFFVHVADITAVRLGVPESSPYGQTKKEQDNKPIGNTDLTNHNPAKYADTLRVIIEMFNTVDADINRVPDFLKIIFPGE